MYKKIQAVKLKQKVGQSLSFSLLEGSNLLFLKIFDCWLISLHFFFFYHLGSFCVLISNSECNHVLFQFTAFDKKNNNSVAIGMRTAALKQTPRDVAAPRRSHSSIDRAALPAPFPCPFIAPFQRSPPPLSLAPTLVCLFLLADGCPYFSLYPLRSRSPSRLDPSLPFPSLFPLSSSLSVSSSPHFLPSFIPSFLLLLSFLCLPALPPSNTAVPGFISS